MGTVHNELTPVVVLGAKHHGGLHIARSLGKLGVPVYVVDSAGIEPVAFSRYCRKRFVWNLKGCNAEDSVSFLLEVAGKIGRRPILMPTNDHAAIFVADHSEALSRAYLFANQSAERSHALVSKRSLFHLATRHHIATPYTFAPKSMSEIHAFAKTATFPVMLKQDDCGNQNGLRGNFVVRNAEELLGKCASLGDCDDLNLLIQEYIPGGDDCIWMFNGYFNENSDCLFGMTGQKLRQCPIHTGPSCLAICVHNKTVHELTLRFMKAIGYQGILDMGYRYDARDGQYKVLDINPRIGATFRLFVAENGMDVARAQYLDLTNQKVPPSSVREGRKWIVEDWDLVSSFRCYRRGELTISEWLKSLSRIEEASFLSLSDPLPILGALITDLRELAARVKGGRIVRPTPLAKAAAVPEPVEDSSI